MAFFTNKLKLLPVLKKILFKQALIKIMKIDIHIHSTISPCSKLTLDEIINYSQACGLDGVCITDHNTMEVQNLLQEGMQPNGLCIFFGVEYFTPDGDFLLFGPFDKVLPGLSATEVLRWIDSIGGVAIAAHPFRHSRPTQEYLIADGMCRIVESRNGRNSDSENALLNKWRSIYSIHEVGGSDAHSLEELGKVITLFNKPVRSRQELISALKKGSYSPN